MSTRKLRQPGPGQKKPALTRLKELPAEDRARLMAVLRENTYTQAAPLCEQLVGFPCSLDVLSKFWQWQGTQEDLETSNDWLDQFEQFTRSQNPDWSADKVREQAIAFFLAQTAGKKDLKGFVQIAQIDQNERSGRIKAQLDERKVRVAEGRLTLLERKAQQADQAKGVMQDKALTEAQRAARMKEIFGIA